MHVFVVIFGVITSITSNLKSGSTSVCGVILTLWHSEWMFHVEVDTYFAFITMYVKITALTD